MSGEVVSFRQVARRMGFQVRVCLPKGVNSIYEPDETPLLFVSGDVPLGNVALERIRLCHASALWQASKGFALILTDKRLILLSGREIIRSLSWLDVSIVTTQEGVIIQRFEKIWNDDFEMVLGIRRRFLKRLWKKVFPDDFDPVNDFYTVFWLAIQLFI
jgi:hypothetical protein